MALKTGERSGMAQSRLCAHRGLCLLSVLEPGDPARHAAGQYIDRLDKMGLDFAIAATFIAMTLPAMKYLPMVAAHPGERRDGARHPKPRWRRSHIIVSALAGMVVGYVLHRMRR